MTLVQFLESNASTSTPLMAPMQKEGRHRTDHWCRWPLGHFIGLDRYTARSTSMCLLLTCFGNQITSLGGHLTYNGSHWVTALTKRRYEPHIIHTMVHTKRRSAPVQLLPQQFININANPLPPLSPMQGMWWCG